MSRFLVMMAIWPAAFLIWYVYRKDTVEKEPGGLLARLFFLGALISVLVIVVELLFESLLSSMLTEGTVLYAFLENFYGVALVEEAGKFLILMTGTWKSKHFNYLFDGIVYAVVVSLGFATIENIFYVAAGGVSTAIARALLSVPGHAIFGVCMGYFYGLAKRAELRGLKDASVTNLLLALVVPTIIHGTYDFLLSVELFGLFLIFEIVVTVLAVKRINKYSREDAPLE